MLKACCEAEPLSRYTGTDFTDVRRPPANSSQIYVRHGCASAKPNQGSKPQDGQRFNRWRIQHPAPDCFVFSAVLQLAPKDHTRFQLDAACGSAATHRLCLYHLRRLWGHGQWDLEWLGVGDCSNLQFGGGVLCPVAYLDICELLHGHIRPDTDNTSG